jgi:hypothetical protein
VKETAAETRKAFSPSVEALEALVMMVEHPGLSLRDLARRLGYSSHALVLARLQSLEDGYGISLGERRKDQDFKVSPDGRKLYLYAQDVVAAHGKLRRWPPDEAEVLRLGLTPDVMRLLFAPILKRFLARVGARKVNVTLREGKPSTLRRLLGSRRIDAVLQGVMINDRGAIQMEARAPALRARLVGSPYTPVAVARPETFRQEAGALESLDALAAEVKTLCIQRIDYRDLQQMGQLPRARRWVLTDTQAGSVTLAAAGLGAGLIWDVPGLYQQLGLRVRPFRNSVLPRTQLAVWVNAEDEARRRQASARENPRWDPVLTFLDSLPGPVV